ncbi:MAG TPA: nucleotide exchange factor GrpE [Prevotella sp.]
MNKDIDNKAEKEDLNEQCEAQNGEKETADVNVEAADETASAEPVDELALANAKIEELKDAYLRKVAEFDNYVKRTRKEKDELIFNGGEKAISAVLPIIDDMERAIANAGKTDDIKAVEEGWELIYKKFLKALEGLGVKQIVTEDQDFNVDYHEAIAMVPGDDDKKGKVIDCVQTGYTLNEKVIRHAKVAVGQ